ncbi:unnamed protein product [Caenorhabditis auriculariae]|uniref:Uncharacterized protein n=1 Tax=Caenorhabditis auriculariae TaxID=2777116 RepID=A0A8S1HIZ5_9PELO|nr:unnamed protein product [Caenorhabditis auriculariae]
MSRPLRPAPNWEFCSEDESFDVSSYLGYCSSIVKSGNQVLETVMLCHLSMKMGKMRNEEPSMEMREDGRAAISHNCCVVKGLTRILTTILPRTRQLSSAATNRHLLTGNATSAGTLQLASRADDTADPSATNKKMVFKSTYPPLKLSGLSAHEKVLAAVRATAAKDPNAVAFINAENTTKTMLYKDIEPTVNSLATGLKKLGFAANERAVQVLPNCAEYLVNILAVQKCGGAMSNANAVSTEYELIKQFTSSQSTIVFTDEDRLPRVRTAVEKCPLIKKIVCIRTFPMVTEFPANVVDYDVIRKTPAKTIKCDYPQDSIALLPYSSGTTGPPKGVMLTHRNISAMFDMAVNHAETEMSKAMFGKDLPKWIGEHALLMLPFYHAYGLNAMFEIIILGMTGIVFKKYDTIIMLNRIKFYKVKLAYTVPPILVFLANDFMVPIFKVEQFLKVILSAGAATAKRLCDDVKKRFPNTWVAQAYGMTEMVQLTTFPKYEHGDSTVSVGCLGAMYEMKILDTRGNELTKPDERGELCFRGPTIMKGYLNNPTATAETVDKDGWLHSGDIGYVDSKGQVHIVDRIKELLKVNGMQVPPAEIEEVLMEHPKIKDAAVIGVPDPTSGDMPKAFIVKKETMLANEVNVFVQQKLSSNKWLTGGVQFVDAIPRLPSGKIARRRLNDLNNPSGSSESSQMNSQMNSQVMAAVTFPAQTMSPAAPRGRSAEAMKASGSSESSQETSQVNSQVASLVGLPSTMEKKK